MKAIQTEYKGYKFRSRLEARWAVFFDAMGLEWEYEPEGFDTEGGGYYLPDFKVWCHSSNNSPRYFEVKSKNGFSPECKSKYVYLAGKVHEVSDELDVPMGWRECLADKRFMKFKHPFFGMTADTDLFYPGFIYSGPHFSDNHGCVVAHERARHQIAFCEIVFAWINSTESYGTFHEIGFADAWGRDIYIGFGEGMPKKDMWFLAASAKNHGVFPDAKTAWEELVPKPKPSCSEEEKISAFSVHKPITLLMGDPIDDEAYHYRGGGFVKQSVKGIFWKANMKFESAAKKARQARFEHGETHGQHKRPHPTTDHPSDLPKL